MHANKKGRLFHANVMSAGAGGVLIVRPIQRNISYGQLTPSEIADLITRREDRTPPAQTTL